MSQYVLLSGQSVGWMSIKPSELYMAVIVCCFIDQSSYRFPHHVGPVKKNTSESFPHADIIDRSLDFFTCLNEANLKFLKENL